MGSMNSWPINPFDAAVYVALAIAVIAGFNSGLLRSLATIFGYVCAAPVALAMMPYLTPYLASQLTPAQTWPAFFVVFLLAGLVLGALLRLSVSELTGPTVSAADRAAGALLGAVRIALLAVLMVAIFDRIIPPGREPAFLKGSQLRPILSAAAEQGLPVAATGRRRLHRPVEARARHLSAARVRTCIQGYRPSPGRRTCPRPCHARRRSAACHGMRASPASAPVRKPAP
jgi:membrane protein required for colicin V production